MCPGNLGWYYNLEKMKNHHYPETKTRRYDLLSLFLFENQIEQRHDSQSYFAAAVHGPSNPFWAGLWCQCNWHAWLKSPFKRGCNMLLGYFRVKAQPRFLSEGRRCSVGLVFYIGGSSFLIFLEWQKATAVVWQILLSHFGKLSWSNCEDTFLSLCLLHKAKSGFSAAVGRWSSSPKPQVLRPQASPRIRNIVYRYGWFWLCEFPWDLGPIWL